MVFSYRSCLEFKKEKTSHACCFHHSRQGKLFWTSVSETMSAADIHVRIKRKADLDELRSPRQRAFRLGSPKEHKFSQNYA